MIQTHQNQIMRFARALFDNVAEMPRELSFKKGDILTVLQEKYENSSEWWICSLRNMVGLAPANRLEAMPILIESTPKLRSQISASYYDELPNQPLCDNTYSNFPIQTTQVSNLEEYSVYQLPMEDSSTNSTLVNLPISCENLDEQSTYQFPSTNSRKNSSTYFNIPYSPGTGTYSNISSDIRAKSMQNLKQNEYYNNRHDYSDSFSDATSASFTDTFGSSLNSFNQLSLSSSESGDLKLLPPSSTFLPLQLSQDEVISKFRKHQTETATSCNNVIEFAKAKWKSDEMLKSTIKSIKSNFLDFFQNLQVLFNFTSCILENSKTCGDINLTKKIWKHLQPLGEAILTSKEAIEKLEAMNWNAEKIAGNVRLAVREGGDCLSQVVSASRTVSINIRSLGVTIIGNANVLFPELSIEPVVKNEDEIFSWTHKTEETSSNKSNIREIMRLFGQQMKSQTDTVYESVNDFIKILSCQPQSTPSKDTIVSHSKFVVRSATQLVFIAKNLTDAQLKTIPNQKIEQEGNILCNSLKAMVGTTKDILSKIDISNDNLIQLTGLLKSVKVNARNLQTIVIDSVTQQH